MAVVTPVGAREGQTIKYTVSGSAVTQYQVIELGNADGIIGVALEDGAVGETISVAIEGVWTFPKVSAAVIAAGESVDWDTSAGAVDDNAATSATGDYPSFGLAMAAGANGETSILVRLIPKPVAIA